MKTSRNLQQHSSNQTELPSTQYQQDSHVRTSAQQEIKEGLMENDQGFTPMSFGLLATYDLNSSSWKTSQRCFISGLAEFSETWPRSGMTQNGIAYQLPVLAPLMRGTESGLLPTPTAHNAKEGGYPGEFRRNSLSLAAIAGGRINPEWTEWLMGFPINHTALKPSETP